MKTIDKMKRATSDEDVRAIIEFREKAVRDEADRMSFAMKKALMRGKEEGIMVGKEEGIMIGKKEGIMIGEERGERRGKELVAVQMLSLNISIDTIIAATGLSKADIQKLEH